MEESIYIATCSILQPCIAVVYLLPDSMIDHNLGPFVTFIYLRILPLFYRQLGPPGQVTVAPVLKAARAVGVL